MGKMKKQCSYQLKNNLAFSMKLTNITLNKIVDTPQAGDKNPSHRLVASDEKYQNKTTVGAMWLKTGQNGNFLSGSFSKTSTGTDGKEYQGYVLVTEKEYAEYLDLKAGVTPKVEGRGYTGEVTDTSATDF